MTTLQDILNAAATRGIGGLLPQEQGPRPGPVSGYPLPQLGQVSPQADVDPQTPESLEELLRKALQRQSERIPTIRRPQLEAESYAPSAGGGLIFTGGSPFKVNETPVIVQNGLILATELAKVFKELSLK